MKWFNPLAFAFVLTYLFFGIKDTTFCSPHEPPTGVSSADKVINLKLKSAPVDLALKAILSTAGVSYVFGEELSGSVDVNAFNIPWREALQDVLDQVGMASLESDNTFVIGLKKRLADLMSSEKYKDLVNSLKSESDSPVIDLKLDRAPLGLTLKAISSVSSQNILLSPDLQGQVSLRLKSVPHKVALKLVLLCSDFNTHDLEEILFVDYDSNDYQELLGIGGFDMPDVDLEIENVPAFVVLNDLEDRMGLQRKNYDSRANVALNFKVKEVSAELLHLGIKRMLGLD